MTDSWEKSQQTVFTLWDIDREFEKANEAYEQWQARKRRKRSAWACLGVKPHDDALAKTMSLGRNVQRVMTIGKERFGSRFEEGDTTCQTILSAQLLRIQYEIRQPLYDSAFYPTRISLPYDDMITTAKSIRRTCLNALEDQLTRFESRAFVPTLPAPRFKVEYCPFANQLGKDLRAHKASDLRAKKLRPNHRHDDREVCPHCDACISVTPHSGLPAYRGILFTWHVARDSCAAASAGKTTFACNSCYKTFEDSYAFLDHVFQKQIASHRSCMRRTSRTSVYSQDSAECDPSLVEQCLRNCLMRELVRARGEKGKSTIRLVEEEEGVHLSLRGSKSTWGTGSM